MAKNTKRCLVIQPLPGIGDALWHLRAFKALARQSPTGKITLLAKPQSQVDKLLSHEPWIEEILWLDSKKHYGSMGGIMLGHFLRKKNFGEVWILHHSPRYYIAASFAGIRKRYGYGFGWLKGMLTSSNTLDKKYRFLHPIARFETFFKKCRLPLKDEDRFLTPRVEALKKIRELLHKMPHPWTVFGFGATNPQRIWSAERFADLAVALQRKKPQTIFLCGAKSEEQKGKEILALIQEKGGTAELATDYDLGLTCAFLSEADYFIGNDSGLLNLAGALGKKAIGLFGNLGVLEYNQNVFGKVLEKERDRKTGGMNSINVKDVIDALKA